MKKIYLHYYSRKNLGDDLFVKVFGEYFRKYRIILNYSPNYIPKNLNGNVILKPVFFLIVCIRKICDIIGFDKKIIVDIYKKIEKCYDRRIQKIMKDCVAHVKIGGSIFMEKGIGGTEINFDIKEKPDFRIKSSLQNKGKSFIVGVNLGPIFSVDYSERMKDTFMEFNHVCLRDYSSYCMVKELPHVQYAPDVLFMVKQPKKTINRQENVVISVIDIERHTKDSQIIQAYYTKLAEVTTYFAGQGTSVILVSFCENEGDEKAIHHLLSLIKDKNNIATCFYSGDMEHLLQVLADASFIVGSRFHSIILGISFGKPVFPIMYNCKTEHYLQDLDFQGKAAKLTDLLDLTCEDIVYNYRENIITDCTEHKKYAENQFWGLKQFLDNLN